MDSEIGSTAPQLDRQEFARQYTVAYPRLLLVGYAMLGNRAAAEDVVQEAVATALTKMKDFTPGTHFAAWLSQFVRHAALNARRRNNTRKAASLDRVDVPLANETNLPHATSQAIDTEGSLRDDAGHFDDELRRGLNGLQPNARACLLLRTVAELSYEEIAEMLEIPKGTAMSHVHRARQQLRRQLTVTSKPGEDS